ncbi:MAG: AAA family ATPase [Shewanella sp.]|nr:AAA family ATPase [Shewanella sp.]
MKLKKLTLENFRGFKHFECEFQEGINVLVGLNGQGKSSVLDAIAIAYGQFLSALPTGVDKGISTSDVRLAKSLSTHSDFVSIEMESQLPVSVSCEAYTSSHIKFPQQWQRARNTLKGNTTQVRELKDSAKNLAVSVQEHQLVSLPILGYYGTGRLWSQGRISVAKADALNKTSRLEGYRDCMDPKSSYTAFAQWLKLETIANHERQMSIIEQSGLSDALVTGTTLRGKLLEAIKVAVNTVLEPSGWSNVRYTASAKELIASHPNQGNVPISMLSDGVRNMIGMVADIAYRCVRLNRHLEKNAVTQTEGIVLIDEVDMHLHPEWQQLILQNLEEAFPKIQFIVTTHSPQILTTVRKESIRLLNVKEGIAQASVPLGNTYGESSGYVLNHLFGVDSKPPLQHSDTLKKYYVLIESGLGREPQANIVRHELEKMMGKHHSDLMAADRMIQRKELLG